MTEQGVDHGWGKPWEQNMKPTVPSESNLPYEAARAMQILEQVNAGQALRIRDLEGVRDELSKIGVDQRARIAELEAEVARLKARVIPESGGHLESADCWCDPTVEEHPGGTLIIHNQTH